LLGCFVVTLKWFSVDEYLEQPNFGKSER
jgi:hypothetical protein